MRLTWQWQQRSFSHHCVAVVRHEERADVLDAAPVRGAQWCRTKDFVDWPLDPPLSDRGQEKAGALGKQLLQLSSDIGCAFPIVLSSPYYRCMQTAAQICEALGPETRLLVDLSLGEVFGPSVMGDAEPKPPFLRSSHQAAHEKKRAKTVGSWPTWPESLETARMRYASTFLKYLNRSMAARRNFIIVSHGDCVGAALSVMPSTPDCIECIEFGGMFFAHRQCPIQRPISVFAWSTNEEQEQELDLAIDEKSSAIPDAPSSSDSWQLQVHNIKFGKQQKQATQKHSVKDMLNTLQKSPLGKPFSKKSLIKLGLLSAGTIPDTNDEKSGESANSSTRLFGASVSSDLELSQQTSPSDGDANRKNRAGQHSTRHVLKSMNQMNEGLQVYLAQAATLHPQGQETQRQGKKLNISNAKILQRRLRGTSVPDPLKPRTLLSL
mmetsp:Transcript_81375/g.143623  ORF Transcript_81375/g.143623 Transcript_81375/m.143623 type:complete len:437 (+) Transcript_81375:60-1370(+)